MKLIPEHAKLIREQLEKDCRFFEENSIIDYSLLIGVHKIMPKNQIELNEGLGNESNSEFQSLASSIIKVNFFFLY